MHLALASASVGRKNLLSHLKIPFTTIPSTLNEDKIWGKNPLSTLQLRAKAKGEEVAKQITDNKQQITSYLVLSADSGAIIDNQLIGKPKNYKDAVRILKTLSGRTHEFVTAIYAVRTSAAGDAREGSHKELHCHLSPDARRGDFEATSGKLERQDPQKTIWKDYARSYVTYRKLTNEDIKLYLSLTNYTKFAGGYALASAQNFITKVQGSISNVIGLPLEKVIPILKENKLL